jgi:hypothetical protein
MVFGFDDQLLAATGGAFGDPFAGAQAGASIEIQQLEGARPITVLLRGRAMPYQGVAWEGEQHSKLTWYPGNPVATQQVLGPREAPTTMSGMWKDRFIRGAVVKNGDAAAVTTAMQAVQLFDQLWRSGKRVRVQWAQFVRVGIIKRFVPTADRAQDIAWELEFEWSSRDDEVAPRAATQESAPAGSNLLRLLNDLEDVFVAAPAMAAAFTAQIVSTIRDVRDRVATVIDSLRTIETLVNLPAAVVGALKNSVLALSRQLLDFEHRILGARSSAQDTQTSQRAKGGFTNPGRLGRRQAAQVSSAVVQELEFEAWRRTLGLASRNLNAQLIRILLDVLARTQPATTRVVVVREKQSLYSLATQFYGSPDFANFLAQQNRLTSALVPAGFRLRVPERPLGAAAQVDLVTDHQPAVSDGKCC